VTQKFLRNEHYSEIRRGKNSLMNKKTSELKHQMLDFTMKKEQQCIVAKNEQHQEKGQVTFSVYYPKPTPKLTKTNLNFVVHSTIDQKFQKMDPLKRKLLSDQIVQTAWSSTASGGMGPALKIHFQHKSELKTAKDRAKAQGIPFEYSGLYGYDYDGEEEDSSNVGDIGNTPQHKNTIGNKQPTVTVPQFVAPVLASLPSEQKQQTSKKRVNIEQQIPYTPQKRSDIQPNKILKLNPLPQLPILTSTIFAPPAL
jgi:hypothetical protein